MEQIDIILIILIFLTIGVLLYKLLYKNGKEGLVNLDESRKKMLTKCCENPPCYDKPPYLRENCIENKENADKQLDTQFKQQYTQEEYYKLLNDLNILKEENNKLRESIFLRERDEKIVIDKNDDNILKKAIKDDRDEVKGYDKNVFASYK